MEGRLRAVGSPPYFNPRSGTSDSGGRQSSLLRCDATKHSCVSSQASTGGADQQALMENYELIPRKVSLRECHTLRLRCMTPNFKARRSVLYKPFGRKKKTLRLLLGYNSFSKFMPQEA